MIQDLNPASLVEANPQIVLQAVLAQNLMSFTEFAFGAVRPNVPFKSNWHLEAVTWKLAQVESGDIRRLIITLPPRNLKSLCASVALPAWFLGRNRGSASSWYHTLICSRAPMQTISAGSSMTPSMRLLFQPCG